MEFEWNWIAGCAVLVGVSCLIWSFLLHKTQERHGVTPQREPWMSDDEWHRLLDGGRVYSIHGFNRYVRSPDMDIRFGNGVGVVDRDAEYIGKDGKYIHRKDTGEVVAIFAHLPSRYRLPYP